MTPPKNPTNQDLLDEIKTMQAIQQDTNRRLGLLEDWRTGEKAIQRWRRDNRQSREDRSKMEVFQALLPFIVALTALAYALISYFERVK